MIFICSTSTLRFYCNFSMCTSTFKNEPKLFEFSARWIYVFYFTLERFLVLKIFKTQNCKIYVNIFVLEGIFKFEIKTNMTSKFENTNNFDFSLDNKYTSRRIALKTEGSWSYAWYICSNVIPLFDHLQIISQYLTRRVE